MFTGIIRQVAPVVSVVRTASGARLAVELGPLAGEAARGDSISINGVCLTVAAGEGGVCHFDVVAETLARSTLGRLRPGDRVNVEPALRAGDALGGHFVLGHVDGVGTVRDLARTGEGATLRVGVPHELAAMMVPKGSVAVDGVGLTVVEVRRDAFTCALIPTTLSDTTLGTRRSGDFVNVETDLIGKYVARYLGARSASPDVTLDKLRDAGFA